MINDTVISEIYKNYRKPPKEKADLRLDYFLSLLKTHHHLKVEDESDLEAIVNEDLDIFSPFRRFLIRSLNAVLEFDRMVAFVFKGHILFFGIDNKDMRVHIKKEEPKSWFKRLLGGN